MTSASRLRSAARLAAIASVALAACADIDLDTIKDPGSTVPVPDMTGPVAFAENGLTGEVLVSGTAAAVTPLADVLVENQTTSTVDRTTATDQGAFSVVLTDADIGDTVSLTVELDGETSDSVDLPLVYDGEPIAAPLEVHAFVVAEVPGTAEVSAGFPGASPPLVVRVVNHTTGLVVEGTTVPSGDNRGIEIIIAAELHDEIMANGTVPEHPGAPGRFGRTEVVPR